VLRTQICESPQLPVGEHQGGDHKAASFTGGHSQVLSCEANLELVLKEYYSRAVLGGTFALPITWQASGVKRKCDSDVGLPCGPRGPSPLSGACHHPRRSSCCNSLAPGHRVSRISRHLSSHQVRRLSRIVVTLVAPASLAFHITALTPPSALIVAHRSCRTSLPRTLVVAT
jgi:hypothetical protein